MTLQNFIRHAFKVGIILFWGFLACYTSYKLYKMCAIKKLVPGAIVHTYQVTQKLQVTEQNRLVNWVSWTDEDVHNIGNHRIAISAERWAKIKVGDPIEIITIGKSDEPYRDDDVYTDPGNFGFDIVLLITEVGLVAVNVLKLRRTLREK